MMINILLSYVLGLFIGISLSLIFFSREINKLNKSCSNEIRTLKESHREKMFKYFNVVEE